jgi:hypothetical protein
MVADLALANELLKKGGQGYEKSRLSGVIDEGE